MKSEGEMSAGGLAASCGVGVSTIHDYRARGILKPFMDNGKCRYSAIHVGVVKAVIRLKSDEFRRRKCEIEELANRLDQQALGALAKMPRKKVESILEKYQLR